MRDCGQSPLWVPPPGAIGSPSHLAILPQLFDERDCFGVVQFVKTRAFERFKQTARRCYIRPGVTVRLPLPFFVFRLCLIKPLS